MKRLILITILISLLSGCSVVTYVWDSPDYEKQLVSLDSEKGKRRLKQIVDFDPVVENMISTGYQPTHLYELNIDEFYLISADGKGRHYRFVRPDAVNSQYIEVYTIPDDALRQIPLHYPIISQQLQNDDADQGTVASHDDAPVASKEAGGAEPKPEPKPTPLPKSLEKAYHIEGTHPTIFIRGHKRKLSLKRSDYTNFEYVVVGQVIEDKTVRLQDDFVIDAQRVRTGYRKAPNAKYVRAQLDVERAQRRYIEAVNQSNQPVGGDSYGLAFLTGMVRQKTLNDAEEALYDAKMRAIREPEYVNEPVYEYQNKKVYRANMERTVKVKLTKYQGSTKVGETVLTKKFSDTARLEDQAAINATMSRLKRKTVNLDIDRVKFN